MKILVDHALPFGFAHGGFQVQVEQTKQALERIGLEVDWLRWWDDRQPGDLVHYFGAPSPLYLELARARKVPVVMTNLFTASCNRPVARLRLQGLVTRLLFRLPIIGRMAKQLYWESLRMADCNIVGLEAERRVLQLIYGVPRERTEVVPLGLSPSYLQAGAGSRHEPHLICVGTITERKNSVELAELARRAEVPILFVGKPYAESDPYWQRFRELIDDRWVRYHPHVDGEAGMIALLQAARGAVIMSRYENWCLAAHEAAACGLPLLLPDQPWSRDRFGEAVRYFPGQPAGDGEALRRFYAECPQLAAPTAGLHGWEVAARQLQSIYERLLKTSR